MKQIVCMKVTPKVDQIKFDEAKKVRDFAYNYSQF